MNEAYLQPTLSDEQFTERFEQLHRQLWQSPEFDFDSVTRHVYTPPKGMYQVDHSFMHDGDNWHLYYLTGDMTLSEPWNQHRKTGDLEGANRFCVEPGNGHAVGTNLFNLQFVEHVFFEPQGRFDLMSRGVCSLFEYANGPQKYGMLYDVRGDQREKMCLAWSNDLHHWTQDERNPVLGIPSWANPHGSFKDPHIMKYLDVYLIYVVAWNQTGQPCIALITTEDWKTFQDHGPVFAAAPQMRGTFGIESPQVIHRNGMWHLFYTHGTGLWHAVAPSPTEFLAQGEANACVRPMPGAYRIGPFHASEILRDGDNWYLTTDRKEHQRACNRLARRKIYRGQYEDEQPLEEGLYLSNIIWDGDQPTLAKPEQQ